MKLTWFGGTTIRIHIGGQILVADPDGAPAGVDRGELVSGADRSFSLADQSGLAPIDAAEWRPRVLARAIDDAAAEPVLLHRLSSAGVLVDAPGEPPLVLLTLGEPPRLGRWADRAVVVLFDAGAEMAATADALLTSERPRLIALAADEGAVNRALSLLRDRVGTTAVISLEPGLALEV